MPRNGRRPHSASIELIERAPENSGAEALSLSRVRRAANSGEQSWSIKPHSTESQPWLRCKHGQHHRCERLMPAARCGCGCHATGEVVQASETTKAANQMEKYRRRYFSQCANMTRGVAHAR